TVDKLRERFPTLQSPPSDDICYATQNRQVAIKKIAPDADLVLVVGSPNSAHAVRQTQVAREAGATASHRIDSVHELRDEWFEGVETVGVPSGASVPDVLVQQLLNVLADRGYGNVEPVRTATEDLMFSLPRELRQEMKSRGAVDTRTKPTGEAATAEPCAGRGPPRLRGHPGQRPTAPRRLRHDGPVTCRQLSRPSAVVLVALLLGALTVLSPAGIPQARAEGYNTGRTAPSMLVLDASGSM